MYTQPLKEATMRTPVTRACMAHNTIAVRWTNHVRMFRTRDGPLDGGSLKAYVASIVIMASTTRVDIDRPPVPS